jgi:hypothetical protein
MARNVMKTLTEVGEWMCLFQVLMSPPMHGPAYHARATVQFVERIIIHNDPKKVGWGAEAD